MALENPDDLWSNRTHPIKEDMAFQRSQWVFERIAWCCLCGIIVLALIGLFSAGPLSHVRVGDVRANLQMDFQRFHRNGALTDLTLFLLPGHTAIATLNLNTSFIEAFAIEDVQPFPVLSRSSPDGISFVFDASHTELTPIYFSVRPRHVGLVSTSIRLNDHEPVELTIFIYP